MHKLSQSAQVEFSVSQVHKIVTDIHLYPEFLPGISKGEVLSIEDDHNISQLTFNYLGIEKKISTKNFISENLIHVELEDGPFNVLEGDWKFTPKNTHTHIEFVLSFSFNNLFLDSMLTPIFRSNAQNIVESFVKRAHFLYGK